MSALASRFHHAHDALRPPQAPGLGRGMVFAAVAHLLLLLALSAGVHWRTQTLPTYEAELWAAVPQAAAPREQLPPEEPPAPKPQPRPEPKPDEPDPRALQAQRDAEIAIAKAEKKKKDLEQKRLAELEAERKAKLLAKKELALKQRQAEAAAAKDAKDAKEAKQAEAKREAQRQENLRRIQGMAGASGGPGATGAALQSSGPSASYGGRIKARIRPNIIYSDTPSGNPVTEVEVRVAPDGTIIGKKIVKASGDAEWDKAVLRAIDKTETLPRDVDGRVPSLLVISFQPRE